jgi:hypothetical protein
VIGRKGFVARGRFFCDLGLEVAALNSFREEIDGTLFITPSWNGAELFNEKCYDIYQQTFLFISLSISAAETYPN